MINDDESDMAIVTAIGIAVVTIRDAFNLSSDEAEELIDTLYDKLARFADRRKNEHRTK